MRNIYRPKNFYSIALIMAIMGFLPAMLMAQTVVTKCYSGAPLTVNNTGNPGTAMTPINFSAADFPTLLSPQIVKLEVEVSWTKADGACGTAVTGGLYNVSEVGFKLQDPLFVTRNLAASANMGAPGPTWAGPNNTPANNIVTNFTESGASLLPAGLPVSGNFQPNGSTMGAYIGMSPLGNWTFIVVDDAPGGPMLCVTNVCVKITACDASAPNAACQGSVSLALDATGSRNLVFADLNNNSDTSCMLQSVTFSPISSFNCTHVGSTTPVTMTLTNRLGGVSSCVSNVTIVDNTGPTIAQCQIPFPTPVDTLYLNASGTFNYLATSAVTASDNCGVASRLIRDFLGVYGPSVTLTCANRGANNLSIRAIDVNGNQTTCTVRVMVFDTFPPTAVCRDTTIYLNSAGSASADPTMIDGGSSDVCTPSNLLVRLINGASSQTYTCANIGPNVAVLTVRDNNTVPGPNSRTCNATVTVRDTVRPVANCRNFTVNLSPAGTVTLAADSLNNASTDNCGPLTFTVGGSPTMSFTCANLGPNARVLTVTDGQGNSSTCNATVTVQDVTPPNAICQSRTVYLNSSGTGSLAATAVNNGSNDVCWGTTLTYLLNSSATVNYTCANIGTRNDTLRVTDGSGNSSTCLAAITVVDTIPPSTVCQNYTAYLNSSGQATVLPSHIDGGSTDNCGIINRLINNSPSVTFTCAQIGAPQAVTLTVTGGGGNNSTCNATVTVLDTVRPTAICRSTPVVVNLGPTGTVSVSASSINNGSSDNCGGVTLLINGAASHTYNCSNVGLNNATLTVTDNVGNSSTCVAQVQVNDNLAPLAICQSPTVYVNAVGTVTVTASQIRSASSSDNCGIVSSTINGQASVTYNCDSLTAILGSPMTATLTVRDAANNSSSCPASVTVVDTIRPNAVCQNITANLNTSGQVTVTGNMIDGGSSDNCGIVSYLINNSPSAVYNCSNIGLNNAVLTVQDASGNSRTCNATIDVVDVTTPNVVCQNITVYLSPAGTVTVTPSQIDGGTTDNCTPLTYTINGQPNFTYTCANAGFTMTATLFVQDPSSNFGQCNAQVTVLDTIRPVANCNSPLNVYLGTAGTVTVTSSQINNGSTDNCSVTSTNINGFPSRTFNCTNLGANTVTLNVRDASNNIGSCNATVNVFDTIRPNAVCRNITVYLDGTGSVTVLPSQVNNGSTDNCGTPTLAFSTGPSVTYTCANLGPNNVTLVATDASGNSSSCNSIITVQDTTRPVATCQNITVNLDAFGNVTVFPNQINNGSSDACGISVMTINGAASQSYNCSNIGPNNATLTVRDVNNNTSTCTAVVTVQDVTFPTVSCNTVSLFLGPTGTVTLLPSQINAGSSDVCGIASYSVNGQPSIVYNCSNIGTNNVLFTATDSSGNASSCNSTATVADTTRPVANCQNISVNLSPAGTVTVNASQINNNSTDNCSIASITFSSGSSTVNYTCANIGPNSVTLRVTDGSGNVSTCNATVTVNDVTPPTATCQSAVVYVNSSGVATVTAAQINNGSSDNCGIASMSVSPSSLNCTNIAAPTTVTLTVTDNGGNTATCTAQVTVQDTVRPTMVCANATVYLNSTGVVSVTPSQINGGTSDACGIAQLLINGSSNQIYTCADRGVRTATLSATDIYGNTASCTAQVTVQDTVRPTARCRSTVTAALNAAGTVTVTPSQIDSLSTDNCNVNVSAYLINGLSSVTYNCSHISANQNVVLTVFDSTGNSRTCNSVVLVRDVTPPTAQCVASLNVNLSSITGTVTVNAISLNNGSSDACGPLTYLINNQPSFVYNCTHIGPNTATLSVRDGSGNTGTCTTTVTVNDITPPTAQCVSGLTVNLGATGTAVVQASSLNNGSTDNCAVTSYLIAGQPSRTFNCSNIGNNLVVLTVRDSAGNSATCSTVVTVRDQIAPVAVCPSGQYNAYLGPTGIVNITGAQIDNGSTDNCSIFTRLINGTSSQNYTCSQIGLNNATLTVRDSSGNSNSCPLVIRVQDTLPPVANCQNISVTLNATTGLAVVNAIAINSNSTDNCGISNYLINGQATATFDCTNTGPNIVTLTVSDNFGNQGQCQSTITVVDNTTPVISCSNRTFYLNAAGQVTVQPLDVATGVDACGIIFWSIDSLNSRVYNCSAAGGTFQDTIRATDPSGNFSTCIAQVSIRDTISPVASCQNITVQLSGTGTFVLTPSMINNNSFDNCTIVTYLVNNQPSITFNCSNVGTNTVTLRVVDQSGNASTCTATVTVQDNIPPTAICRNITVTLNTTGQVTVPAINLNNGSSDACGPLTFTVNNQSSISFNCSNIGNNPVILEVRDANGNVSQCNATITVADSLPPTLVCQTYTLFLNNGGTGTVFPSNVVNGASSFDNCSIASYQINGAPSVSFDCSQVGTRTVTVTASDFSGNTSTCTATVNVVDNIRPTVNCNSFVVNLTAIGSYTLTNADLGVTASDACGISSIVLQPNTITCSDVGIVNVRVIATDVNGNKDTCISPVTVVLDGPQPTSNAPLCETQTLQLFANPPATGFNYFYNWSGPNGFTSATANPSVSNVSGLSQGYYVVTVTPQTASGCPSVDSVFVDINVVPPPVIASNAPHCNGSQAILTLGNASDYSGVSYTYQWFYNGTSIGSNIDTFMINPVSFSDTGSYTMIITVDGCTDSSAVPYVLVVHELPAPPSPTANEPCEGQDLVLNANPPAGTFSYNWGGPLSFNSNQQDPIITNAGLGNIGTYSVTITDVNTCTATNTVTANVKPTPTRPDLMYNVPLCIGDIIELTDTTTYLGTPISYVWAIPGQGNDTTLVAQHFVSNGTAGVYGLTVIIDGCSSPLDTQSVVYELAPIAINDAYNVPFRDSIRNMEVILNDSPSASYFIELVDSARHGTATLNVNGTFNYTPGFVYFGYDTFTYRVCDAICPSVCDTAMVIMDVILDQRCFMSNGISPNGDGINDELIIVCRDQYPNMAIQIFSRWGNLVYQGVPQGWNGQYKGNDLPDGTYFYILDYGDGTKPQTGYIILHR